MPKDPPRMIKVTVYVINFLTTTSHVVCPMLVQMMSSGYGDFLTSISYFFPWYSRVNIYLSSQQKTFLKTFKIFLPFR